MVKVIKSIVKIDQKPLIRSYGKTDRTPQTRQGLGSITISLPLFYQYVHHHYHNSRLEKKNGMQECKTQWKRRNH